MRSNMEVIQVPTRSLPMKFGRWILIFMIAYALGHLAYVVLLGVAFKLDPRALIIPYLLLIWTGFVGGSLFYWARSGTAAPRANAKRVAIATFVFLEAYLGTVLVGAVLVGVLSRGRALGQFGLPALAVSTIAAMTVYWMAKGQGQPGSTD